MKKHCVLCIVCILSLLSAAVHAGGSSEEVSDSETEVIEQIDFTRPRRMVFLFEAPESFSEFNKFFIYNSVLTQIFGSTPEVVILESEEDEIPPTFEGKQELIRRTDADSWVFVQVQGDLNNVTYYYETFDLLKLIKFGETTIETGLRLDFKALSRGIIWEGLVEVIKENFFYLVNEEKLTINALPGTTISGLTSEDILIDETGATALDLPNPAIYSYRAVINGHYPIENELYLGFNETTLELEQKSTIRWNLDILLNNFQFFGVNVAWFPVPADVFFKLGFKTYAFGLYLISNSPDILRTNPLSVIRLDGGFYFLDKINLLRPYLALGAGLRLDHSEGKFIDEITPAEISLTLGAEISLPDRFLRFYAEYNPIMFISTDINEFKAASFLNYLFSDNEIPGFIFADETLAFDLRNFNLGVRFSF
ncbi:MAG: hypothetical protein ACR2PY_07605 [Salinispira sp.]